MNKRWTVGFGIAVGLLSQPALGGKSKEYTPRSYMDAQLELTIGKLKMVAGVSDTLKARKSAIEKAAKAQLEEVVGELKAVHGGLKDGSARVEGAKAPVSDAQRKTATSIAECDAMTGQLSALPAMTPGRDSLVKQNQALCKNLRGIQADLELASTALKQAGESLATAGEKLTTVTAQLNGPLPEPPMSNADKKQQKELMDQLADIENVAGTLATVLTKTRKYNSQYGAVVPVFTVGE